MTDRRRPRPSNSDARHGRHGRSATVDNPRRVAYEVLAAVSAQDAYANLVLPKLLRHRGVAGRDAAFATELCYGALRRRGTLDAVIAEASGRSITALDQAVADVLRLGAYQLLYTRVAAHAAANTTVSLARSVCGHRPAGFVNAVMRKISRYDVNEWVQRLSTGEELADLALRYSHPQWIVSRFAEALDAGEAVEGGTASGSTTVTTTDTASGTATAADATIDSTTGTAADTASTAAAVADEATGAAADAATGTAADYDASRRTAEGADGAGFAIEVDETGFLPETYVAPVHHGDPADDETSGPKDSRRVADAGSGSAETAATCAADAAEATSSSSAKATESPENQPASGVSGTAETATGSAPVAEPGSELAEALAADNVSPAVQLFARPGRSTAAELAELTGGRPGRWSPYAVELDGGDPGDLAAIRDGDAHVQDEGSQLVALALANAPLDGRDERWLDLCAGPGGKAALLASLAALRQARLTAVEVAEHRARLVAQTTAGLDVEVLTADGRTFTAAEDFDRILVDAPCSGLGALRRRPEARWRRSETDLTDLEELQTGLLASALRLVRPGGLVAYVTCSPVLAETTGILATIHNASLVDVRPYFPSGMPDLGDGPTVQLWPHRHGTDAMFCALLRRDP